MHLNPLIFQVWHIFVQNKRSSFFLNCKFLAPFSEESDRDAKVSKMFTNH